MMKIKVTIAHFSWLTSRQKGLSIYYQHIINWATENYIFRIIINDATDKLLHKTQNVNENL